MAGVARRAWARNPAALAVAAEYNQAGGRITLPYLTEEDVIDRLVAENYVPGGK
jgi:urocanate hydratase